MKHFEITISLRDAARAQMLLNAERGLREGLTQTSTNTYEDYYDEGTFGELLDEEYSDECLMDYLDEFTSWLDDMGIEYEKEVWEE